MRRESMPRTCWDELTDGFYDTREEKALDRPASQQHINLDYGRRSRLLPRDQQPDCGCDECLQIRLKREREQAGQ